MTETPENTSILRDVLLETLTEQRRARRWRMFFKFLLYVYFGLLIYFIFVQETPTKLLPTTSFGLDNHIAVININGVIAPDNDIDALTLLPLLQQAYENDQSTAVFLRINSPGGTPVQAGLIHDEILRLRQQYKKPTYAIIEDIGASGAYYIAVAAEKIIADKASLVGSIGVRLDGFGFTELMTKIGVERRAIGAGDNKFFLDPFQDENKAHVEHATTMLAQVHQQFIDAVRQGRGERLPPSEENSELFSGLVWSGEESVQLGLVDQLGSVNSLARSEFDDTPLLIYEPKEPLGDQLFKWLGVKMQALLRAPNAIIMH